MMDMNWSQVRDGAAHVLFRGLHGYVQDGGDGAWVGFVGEDRAPSGGPSSDIEDVKRWVEHALRERERARAGTGPVCPQTRSDRFFGALAPVRV
jgi:hypothetical protein